MTLNSATSWPVVDLGREERDHFPVPSEQAPVSISLVCRGCAKAASLTDLPVYHSISQLWCCPDCRLSQTVFLQGSLVT